MGWGRREEREEVHKKKKKERVGVEFILSEMREHEGEDGE